MEMPRSKLTAQGEVTVSLGIDTLITKVLCGKMLASRCYEVSRASK